MTVGRRAGRARPRRITEAREGNIFLQHKRGNWMYTEGQQGKGAAKRLAAAFSIHWNSCSVPAGPFKPKEGKKKHKEKEHLGHRSYA